MSQSNASILPDYSNDSGGGAIESINTLVGAITLNSVDGSLNVAPTSATNISFSNPNLISLNGAVGISTLTSTDDSITITNTANNINLSTAGGGSLVLHFSGVTDANGSYTNLLGDNEGYVMLDTTYAVSVSQTSLTDAPIIMLVTKSVDSVVIETKQTNAVVEAGVSFDCILVATNYRKGVSTPTSYTFPSTGVIPQFSTTGGGDPFNLGFVPTGSNITTPGSASYINPALNPTVTIKVDIAGQMASPASNNFIPNNTLLYGIYGEGLDNLIVGFSMPTTGQVPLPIDNGTGIPGTPPPANFTASATIPYATLTTANTLFYGLFLSFPCAPLPGNLIVTNLQYQVTLEYNSYQ